MANTSYEEVFQKIRINFLFNHPFLSVLALSIPTFFETNAKSAFETNGSQIKIDREKLSAYKEDEITFLYAHTLLHIVLKHPTRQKTRDKVIWNQSCNLVVNLILNSFSNVGKIPNDELLNFDLENKCVEEVYEILYEKQNRQYEDEAQEDKSEEEQNIKTTPDEKGELEAYLQNESKLDIDEVSNEQTNQGEQEKLDGIIIQALSIAKRTTNTYSSMQIEIDTLIRPEINLQEILKEYLIASLFEKNSTYNRPNRKFISQNIYMPGHEKSKEMIELYVALDSSSSVSLDEYKQFLGVVQEICESFYEYKVTVLPFDLKVKEELIIGFDSFNTLQQEALYIPKSDGGTNFDEVLRYLSTKCDIRSDNLLMVLSDGEFDISEHLVSQTLFIINESKNLKKFEPYGRVIQFNL